MESKRIESLYKDVVLTLSQASTCARVKVGALLVKDGRIICTGWNGVPSGEVHCEDIFKEDMIEYTNNLEHLNKIREKNESISEDDVFYKKYMEFRTKHHAFAVDNELHAEQNLIAFCAKEGISMEGTTLYITVSPCSQCAKLLVASKVKTVKYIEKYDGDNGLNFLIKNGVECIQI